MKVDPRTSQQSSPQGLRRPRFSFFRFTCQTARDRDGPTRRQAGEPSKFQASDPDRTLGSPNISEVLRRRDIAPRGGQRAVWGLYSLAAGGLSTPKPESRDHKIAASFALNRDRLGPPIRAATRRNDAKFSRSSLWLRWAGREWRGNRGIMCGVPVTPHCGHIPRPFFGVLVGGVSSGVFAPGSRDQVTRPALPEIG
jgi:hypothetical protein